MQKDIIFTDGSARGNPGPGGFGAIVVLGGVVQELGGNEKHTTNNRMELSAVITALEHVSKLKTKNSKLVLHTDSSYVLNGATKWVHGWQKNNWKTKDKKDVLNKDLWERLGKLLPKVSVEWKLVKGHTGVPANERCDVIATTYADGSNPKLYKGPLSEYEVDLSVSSPKANSQLRLTAQSTDRLKNKNKKLKTGPAHSYVSMVSGVIKTHKTWAECEKRVKGVSNTKFKKSVSPADEKMIIDSWKASR